MKVRIISQYFRPQPLANAEVVGGVAEGLARRGHEVEVVTPVRHATVPGVRVRRAPGYFAGDRASLPKRVVEYASFSVTAAFVAALSPRADVLLVPSPPPTLGVVGVLVGALRRTPVVYNVQDLYPEVAAVTGVGTGWVLRALGAVMRWVYRRCSAVIVIDPRFEAPLSGLSRGRVRAVRNAIDLEPFLEEGESLRAELSIPDDAPVVMYAGNIGRSQDLESVINATRDAGATLVIHGDGATLPAVKAFVKSSGYSHVVFSSFRSRSELGRVFSTPDIHIVPLRPGVASASVPSKLLSIFAAGRPAIVLAEPDSATADLVREVGAGWVVPPEDPSGLADALGEALADRDRLEARGRAARAWALENASIERAATAYEEILEAVR